MQPRIVVSTDGPYLMEGTAALHDWLGEEIACPQEIRLCRCGGSATLPFCDDSHLTNGFSGDKDPSHVPDRVDTYVGQQVTVYDNRAVCQHAGFCTDRLNTVFRAGQDPFVAPSGGRMDEIVRAVRDCPSGALSFGVDDVERREDVDYHGTRPPVVAITRDGPIRVTGAIQLVDDDGNPVERNGGTSTEHYTLCRCGHSKNKPFCSGMHWYVEFRDPPLSEAPSIFEWAGGMPALLRMTRLFYEKHVPNDPLLAPVFASMSRDHPERVAAWLAEVFGGPTVYGESYGGYTHMIAEHANRGLGEEQRARWVALLLQSAGEAGLPNDAEFRSTFSSYVEWGSRLAVENSQPGAHPPTHMPMPHWDWHTAAGPPGSRQSALEPQAVPAEVILPSPGEALSFQTHIKALFRERDRASMSFAFDLWAHADVSVHAEAILARLRAGTMPCDGAWPPAWTQAFQQWIDQGAPA